MASPTTPLCFFFFLLLLLLSLAEQETTNSNSTTISPPASKQLDPRFNPSMAVLIVVLMTAFFFVAFFSIYIRQCGSNLGTGGGGGGQRGGIPRLSRGARRGIDPSVIDRLPTLLYSDVKGHRIGKHDSPLECAVCLSDFADSDLLRLIPHCAHAFHPNCIDLWLSSHSTCPVCRHDLSSFSSPSSGDLSVHVIDDDPPPFDPPPPPPPPTPPPTTTTTPPTATATERWGEEERERRFTLRLPEKVRREVMEGRLNRSVSMVALPVSGGEGSTRRGGGGGGGSGSSRGVRRRQQVWVVKSDRWAFIGRTLTWPKREDSSVKGGGGEEGSVGREGSSKGYVIRSPLHCLGGNNGSSDEAADKNLEVEEGAIATINRVGGGRD